jgi:hypothetical protein
LRIHWRFEIFAYLAINELLGIYRRRLEMIISPAISMTLAMTLTPLGLALYGSSIELHKVVISGFIVTGMIMGSSVSTAYYMLEASLETIERLLQLKASPFRAGMEIYKPSRVLIFWSPG